MFEYFNECVRFLHRPVGGSSAEARLWVASAFLLCLIAGSPEGLASQDSNCGAQRSVPRRALDEMSWKQLNRIDELLSAEQVDEAEAALERMMERAAGDPYLQAIVHQALAQVAWQKQEFDSALSHDQQAVELNVLPDDAHFSLMYQIAQLHFMQERYAEALNELALWFCQSPPESIDSKAWALKAAIHSGSLQYEEALDAIETAISLNDEPQEPWFQLSLAARLELDRYREAVATLRRMIELWPDRKYYWIQLSQLLFKLDQEREALDVMALAYRARLLDSQADLTWLSSLYGQAGIPQRAAEVLERGILEGVVSPTRDHWLMVADSWYRAEELAPALQAYEAAGQMSADGSVDLRRAYLLVGLERWNDVLNALAAALEKDGLGEQKSAEAFLLRGIAHFHLEDFGSAESDWQRASRDDKSRDAAQQWLNHLREERKVRAS